MGLRSVLRREGPSGRVGKSCAKLSGSPVEKLCSLQIEMASSSSFRAARNSGVVALNLFALFTYVARGRGIECCNTYGRVFGSSCAVSNLICAPSFDDMKLAPSPYDGGSEYRGGLEEPFGLSILLWDFAICVLRDLWRLARRGIYQAKAYSDMEK
jgi:hypothetical protein